MEMLPLPEVTEHSADWANGYKSALNDVAQQILLNGKQHLVQWLEQQLKAFP
jgi:hypothetical protein